MEFLDGRGAAELVGAYIEREMQEFRKVTERELRGNGVAPAAKEAFNRKPYCNTTGMNFKCRPVLR